MTLKALKKRQLQEMTPKFKLGKQLGAGGNAVVYAAQSGSGSVAVKFLLNTDAKRYDRFRDEVLVVNTSLIETDFVVPVIEHDLPATWDTKVPWYSMPIATPLREHLKGASKPELVSALVQLADGLTYLHGCKIAHRDIKPENLFFFKNTFRYADFGIAKFPESAGLTTAMEPMGPQGYIADEMMRDSASADPFKADVFSLAKTLWGLLTDQPFPFQGQYSRRGRYSLDRLLPRDSFVHEPLDDLLECATDSIPSSRPTAREFAQTLRDVLTAQKNFGLSNSLQWAGAEALTFSVPFTRMEWTDPIAIVEVVKILSRRESLNHFFFPGGGGMDIDDAELTEGGAGILLWHGEGMATVINPIRLTLERLDAGPRASYATLDSAAFEPFGVWEKDEWSEELLRYDEYNYTALPSDDAPWPGNVARVSRYFKPGMFIIAPKGGIYNRIDTYQGKGNALGRNELRAFFERAFKKKHQGSGTFSLRRTVRLVTQPPSKHSTFLHHIDLGTFERLLALDESIEKLRDSDREVSIERFLDPNPEWDAKQNEAHQLLLALSDEQFGELMALIQFGRGAIGDPDDISPFSAGAATDSRDAPYLAGKFGNGYLLRAVKRFGLIVEPKGNNV